LRYRKHQRRVARRPVHCRKKLPQGPVERRATYNRVLSMPSTMCAARQDPTGPACHTAPRVVRITLARCCASLQPQPQQLELQNRCFTWQATYGRFLSMPSTICAAPGSQRTGTPGTQKRLACRITYCFQSSTQSNEMPVPNKTTNRDYAPGGPRMAGFCRCPAPSVPR
jgi:hypothetical protein